MSGNNYWEFPGGPVVRTQHFHCQAWVQSLIKELNPISYAVQPKNEKERVKEKKKDKLSLWLLLHFLFPTTQKPLQIHESIFISPFFSA